MKEIWKFYKETNCNRFGKRVYYVSNYGRVKCNGEFYKCTIVKGYYVLCGEYLHRIVAKLFIPNPYNLPCVDHINTNKLDNRVDNLRWCTHKENSNNPLTLQHLKEAQNNPIMMQHKGTSVLQYTKNNEFVAEYFSSKEAERKTKINQSNIVQCCKQKRYKSAGGYIWRYKEG